MSDVATIRAAIKAKMQSVADIGKVNDYERYLDQKSKLDDLFVAKIDGQDQLRGWYIQRVSYSEVLVDTDRWSISTTWRIRGFMALKDDNATEKVWDDLIDALADAFRADFDLGHAVFSCTDADSRQTGLQLIKQEAVMFANVLCHSADCRLITQHLK